MLYTFFTIKNNRKEKIIEPLQKINVHQLPQHFNHSSGAILSDPEWSIHMNDAWVLGACHAAADAISKGQVPKSIYITLPEDFLSNPSPYVWDDKNNRVKVTGRELIGFTHFGYSIKKTQTRNHLFYQLEADPAKLNNFRTASFLSYGEIMQQQVYSQKQFVIDYIVSCARSSEIDFNGEYIFQDKPALARVDCPVVPSISRVSSVAPPFDESYFYASKIRVRGAAAR